MTNKIYAKTYEYNYKIEAIEQFLDDVEQMNYKWAINFLSPMIEESKKLDFNDYKPKEVEHDSRMITLLANSIDTEIYRAQCKNFDEKYREEYDKNRDYILSFDDYKHCLFLGGSLSVLKKLIETDPRVKVQAENLIHINKLNDKDHKAIRASFTPRFEVVKVLRNNMKERKANIKAQKESNKAFADKFGKDAFNFDLKKVSEGKIEEVAWDYAKLQRDALRREIYYRTEAYVGKLIDMIEIHWGDNGSLNGIVVGESGRKAKVNTIIAGGYNIQCLHYRVLVNPV